MTALRGVRRTYKCDALPLLPSRFSAGSRTKSMHKVTEPFYVGPWLVEPKINRISGNTRSHRVEPKVMGVLVLLSRNPGEVVTREQLFEEVWRGTVVTDDVLTRSISELRKVFADDRRSPGYIETIQKTGYRLIAPVAGFEQGPQLADHAFEADPASPTAAAWARGW